MQVIFLLITRLSNFRFPCFSGESDDQPVKKKSESISDEGMYYVPTSKL